MPFTTDSKLQISPEFVTRVVLGDVAGWSHVRKFGARDDVGTSPTVVATAGTYQSPTTAQALEILSSDANDTAAGTGARTVTIIGLDENWEEQSETVTMNGTTAVDLANTYTRVYRMFVATSGTYATATASSHAGTITLRGDGGGDTWATIVLESGVATGQSQIAVYSVPAGKRAYIIGRQFSVETNKSVTIQFYRRDAADTVSAPYSPMRVIELDRGINDTAERTYPAPVGPFTGPCDIGYFANTSSGTADVSINFNLLLEDV
jgi:hypothetical protein